MQGKVKSFALERKTCVAAHKRQTHRQPHALEYMRILAL